MSKRTIMLLNVLTYGEMWTVVKERPTLMNILSHGKCREGYYLRNVLAF